MKSIAQLLLLPIFAAIAAGHVFLAQAQEIPIPTPRPDSPAAETSPAVEEQKPETEPKPAEPPRIYQAGCAALLTGHVQGKVVAPIDENGCGTLSPIKVTALGKEGQFSVSGEPILNCRMATALADWLAEANEIALSEFESEISGLSNGPGYDCRRRNRSPTGKFSEHAFANAFDINAIALANGDRISVEEYWPHLPSAEEANEEEEADVTPPVERAETREARFLTATHKLACNRFTTVLGPDANASHRSHFHFDLGCHGRDCTYLICE